MSPALAGGFFTTGTTWEAWLELPGSDQDHPSCELLGWGPQGATFLLSPPLKTWESRAGPVIELVGLLLTWELISFLPSIQKRHRYLLTASQWTTNFRRSVAKSCSTPCNLVVRSPPGLSFTISQSLFKVMSIESVMPSNHLLLL